MTRRSRPGKALPWSPRQGEAAAPGVPLWEARPRLRGGPTGSQRSAALQAADKTGAEEHFYRKHMLRRTPVVVATTAGEELRGWIEWYDRDVIKLHSLTEPNRCIAKSEIKFICKHADTGDPQPVPTPPPLTGPGRTRRPRGASRRRG